MTFVTAPHLRATYLLITDQADPRFVEQQETTMSHDLLDDEQLSMVCGGGKGDGTGPHTGPGHGDGSGQGDGLGWLRNLGSAIAGALSSAGHAIGGIV